MLGMSVTELAIILTLALLLLGPDQLPSVAKALGKGMRELRRATDDLKGTFEKEMASLEEEPGTPLMVPKPDEENRMLPRDPGAARASARTAAAGPVANDPGAARAAARMQASNSIAAGAVPAAPSVVAAPVVAGPVVAGPVVAGPVVADPFVAGAVVADPVVADPPPGLVAPPGVVPRLPKP